MRSTHHRLTTALGGLVVAAVALAGCSDDDDSGSADDETTTTVAEVEFTAFCDNVIAADRYFQSLQGPPDPAEAEQYLSDVLDEAPEEIADRVQVVADETRASLESGGETSEAFDQAYDDTIEWMGDNCGFGTLEVQGREYAFSGMPDDLEAGKYAIDFANDGEEVHEMQFVRINDGVTESLEQIAQLPQEEALSKVTPLGGAFVMPGESGPAVVDFSEPGSYGVICFIPEGTTPDQLEALESSDAPPEGAPHFTLGMLQEFEVG